MNALRSLRRTVAKNRMKKAGMEKFCKHSYYGNSWQKTVINSVFSKKWRKYV